MSCWKSVVLAITLVAIAAGGQGVKASDDKDHGVPQRVTLSFGTGQNTAGKPNHHILPGVTKVRVKLAAVAADVVPGVVNFTVAGFHQIFVYNPGTTPEDINAYLAIHDPGNAQTFINDPDNLYYTGINPVLQSGVAANDANPPQRADRSGVQNRSESVGFSVPGMYLVICNVRGHFQGGMFAWVKVVADDDDDN